MRLLGLVGAVLRLVQADTGDRVGVGERQYLCPVGEPPRQGVAAVGAAVEAVHVLPHDDDDSRLHDCQLLDQASYTLLGGQIGLGDRALDAEGAIDDQRIDP